MDDEFYVDAFGNLQKRQNLADWSDYEPWQFWGERYNWIPCEDDIEEFDRIAWRDNVRVQTRDGEAWFNGARFVIGEIRNIKTIAKGVLACLVALHSEGKEPYPHGEKIYRHIKTLFKNGAYRSPREDEGDPWFKAIGEDNSARPFKMRMEDAERARVERAKSTDSHDIGPKKLMFFTDPPPRPGK